MKSIALRLIGLSPLIMMNPRMADPLCPLAREKSQLMKQKKRGSENPNQAKIDQLDWRGLMYWDEEAHSFYLPGENIDACLKEGAMKSRNGKLYSAACFTSEPLVYFKGLKCGRDLDKVWELEEYRLRKQVRVPPKTGARITMVRPIVPIGWVLEPTVEFDEEIIKEEDVFDAAEKAGKYIGLGAWRPRYGRFSVERLES